VDLDQGRGLDPDAADGSPIPQNHEVRGYRLSRLATSAKGGKGDSQQQQQQDVRGNTTSLGKGTRCASPLHPPGKELYPMPIRFLLSLLACALVAQSPAVAASPEQCEAVSTTAMAITGKVRFSPDRITFQNGKFLPLAPAGRIAVTEGREQARHPLQGHEAQ
jgi:hypothetical protein